jgi:hypothetical protein
MESRIISFIVLALALSAGTIKAQVTGTITVNGDLEKYYPVTFLDGANGSNIATGLEIGRSSVHRDSSWRGSIIAKFRYHTYNWGNGSNFIDADIRQSNISNPTYNKLIAGWQDVTTTNSEGKIVIWLRGNTTYSYAASATVSPTVYDGVQHPLSYPQTGGPTFTFKTAVDAYVNTYGMSYGNTAFFNGTNGYNYFGANVGIGNDTPAARLHVEGAQGTVLGKFTQTNTPLTDAYLNITNATGATGSFIPCIVGRTKAPGRPLGIYITGEAEDVAATGSDVNYAAVVLDGRNKTGAALANSNILAIDNYGQNLVLVKANGSVGIGTTDTKGYKLAVNGNAVFTKVKVAAYANWPDYVFDSLYTPMPLDTLAQYVKNNKHLPEVPAAAVVAKEGMDLGDMNKTLMQKVEELTLYLIEMNKRNKALEERMQQMEKEMEKCKR